MSLSAEVRSSRKQVKEIAPAMAVPPRMLALKDAAVYLGTTVWQMRTLVWNKRLVALRLGHRQVFDRADLDAFIEKLKRAA
jgi:excisionase family DNA binding protein